MDTEEAELELVKRLRKHEAAALESVMDLHADAVYGLVSRILRSVWLKEDIEECVSDVFMACWNKIGDYDPGRGTLRTWLLLIAKFKALDYRRKMSGKTEFDAFPDDSPGAELTERTVLAKEEREEMMRIVNAFSPLDRVIFYKRYFYYESFQTIANSVGLTPKAVECRLSRARKLLKQRLYCDIREGLS
ncbi:sigma-70 family RNA polymerase sigma factor [Paenibacillus hodogayensis]|uniref:Sigma-70 family RNA polymerase sigma factor n=1 Tax=Paenibacillus hodogayensis TaxID=279208 RepID=A0ABV5VYN9_9BACL